MARRITLVIHSLQGGGAERIAAAMANHWSKVGNHVTLLTLDSADNDVYSLDESIDRVGLDLMKESSSPLTGLFRNLSRIKTVRRAIHESRPDIVVSLVVHMNILTLMACRKLGVDVIVCEHTDPRHHDIGPFWSRLRRWTYPRCRALTVLTSGVTEFARKLAREKPVYVVPNPVLVEQDDAEHHSKGETRFVVGMGRLAWAKGFDRLIEAFKTIEAKHPDWKLRIFGDGQDRKQLEHQINDLNLIDRVEMMGWVDDPYEELRRSDLFVLSSRFEGFPVVLLEAMACGLAVVSFDCESGPAEIIRDGVDGVLVPANDVRSLSEAMDRLMSDNELRQQLASRATEVSDRFSQELFFRRWEAIFDGMPEEEFRQLSEN